MSEVHDSLVITAAEDDETLPVKFRASKLASNHDYTVHRIELYFVTLRDRAIHVRWNGQLLARYTIGDDDTVNDQARDVDVKHHENHWMCSFDDVIQLSVEGNAIAYQIDWEDDRTTVLADARLLWRSGSESTVGDHSVLSPSDLERDA